MDGDSNDDLSIQNEKFANECCKGVQKSKII
jgi:hypothetical protein